MTLAEATKEAASFWKSMLAIEMKELDDIIIYYEQSRKIEISQKSSYYQKLLIDYLVFSKACSRFQKKLMQIRTDQLGSQKCRG